MSVFLFLHSSVVTEYCEEVWLFVKGHSLSTSYS